MIITTKLMRPREENDQDSLACRLASKIEIDSNGCWIWTGSKSRLGYGCIHMGGRKGRVIEAHIVAYRFFAGEIPEGLELDHLCRNRACVNPDHLQPVTHQENMSRGAHAMKTHCIHGHEFTPENTYVNHGSRNCRTCVRRQGAAYRERQRANHTNA
jgi:hypothetical protein